MKYQRLDMSVRFNGIGVNILIEKGINFADVIAVAWSAMPLWLSAAPY